jgi:hypothetical protein
MLQAKRYRMLLMSQESCSEGSGKISWRSSTVLGKLPNEPLMRQLCVGCLQLAVEDVVKSCGAMNIACTKSGRCVYEHNQKKNKNKRIQDRPRRPDITTSCVQRLSRSQTSDVRSDPKLSVSQRKPL